MGNSLKHSERWRLYVNLMNGPNFVKFNFNIRPNVASPESIIKVVIYIQRLENVAGTGEFTWGNLYMTLDTDVALQMPLSK